MFPFAADSNPIIQISFISLNKFKNVQIFLSFLSPGC